MQSAGPPAYEDGPLCLPKSKAQLAGLLFGCHRRYRDEPSFVPARASSGTAVQGWPVGSASSSSADTRRALLYVTCSR